MSQRSDQRYGAVHCAAVPLFPSRSACSSCFALDAARGIGRLALCCASTRCVHTVPSVSTPRAHSGSIPSRGGSDEQRREQREPGSRATRACSQFRLVLDLFVLAVHSQSTSRCPSAPNRCSLAPSIHPLLCSRQQTPAARSSKLHSDALLQQSEQQHKHISQQQLTKTTRNYRTGQSLLPASLLLAPLPAIRCQVSPICANACAGNSQHPWSEAQQRENSKLLEVGPRMRFCDAHPLRCSNCSCCCMCSRAVECGRSVAICQRTATGDIARIRR